MKKVLSVVLSVLIAVLAIVPVLSGVDFLSFKAGASTAGASDAYATVFTASDFQDSKSGNDVEANFSAMIKNALANGDKNVYLINGMDVLTSIDKEMFTVDGCHPNDFGFYCMAKAFGDVIKTILK